MPETAVVGTAHDADSAQLPQAIGLAHWADGFDPTLSAATIPRSRTPRLTIEAGGAEMKSKRPPALAWSIRARRRRPKYEATSLHIMDRESPEKVFSAGEQEK